MEKYKILVAHERPVIARAIARVLAAQGLVAEVARDGDAVWRALESDSWDGLLLDVALPGPPVHQIVALAKTGVPLALRAVILLASVFRRSSYKRRPQQLYGADSYVEGHQLGAELSTKLWRLLSPDPAGPGDMVEAEALLVELQAEAEAAAAAEVAEAATAATGATVQRPRDPAAELADLLVADLLLHAGEKLSDADADAADPPRASDIAVVHEVLADELAQARELHSAALGPATADADPIAAALDRFLRPSADERGGAWT
ncbi:hypothetical protein [Nannocystis sp.]|uniref:hypothetical protein n=1 Tax=Nannocystis sp. TaxID=1962667 RepID=UPI002420AF20|nr:hypothetical protein [Nannocystis sp.]MBK7827778.1 response regulator [Nannocystis sp.]MBK9753818.1 response regulator [Nannocystis sp.]